MVLDDSRFVRVLVAAILSSLLVLFGGCVHPCLALAEEICECEDTESERESCKRQARNTFDQVPSQHTDEAKELCLELLEVCDCEMIATEEGKQTCGLARE